MLDRLRVCDFKSLRDVTIDFPMMTVLFGHNASGKSNILEAIQALSRIGTQRTLKDALGEPIRGYPHEAFRFPPGGLAELLATPSASFSLEAELTREKTIFRYRIQVSIAPESGSLSVADEFLSRLDRTGALKGNPPIEQKEGKLRLRRATESGKPRFETLGQNYAILSDPRLAAPVYRDIETARTELSGWRTYYLDPRVAMRAARSPSEVEDIGVLGDDIAPFLFWMKTKEPKAFSAIRRVLRSIIPSVEDLSVDLDRKRGTLDILIRQGGVDYSSRIVSEGTLRVLAMCAIAVNPSGGSLIAFEEPENGVHPRRIELIAQLLCSLATERKRQVVITTHSPLFCDAVLKIARTRSGGDIGLFNVYREHGGTTVKPFDPAGPLFKDVEISQALTAGSEDGLFESLMMRGMLDD